MRAVKFHEPPQPSLSQLRSLQRDACRVAADAVEYITIASSPSAAVQSRAARTGLLSAQLQPCSWDAPQASGPCCG